MSHQQYIDSRYPLSGLTAKAIAVVHEVHRFLGPGFEEVINFGAKQPGIKRIIN